MSIFYCDPDHDRKQARALRLISFDLDEAQRDQERARCAAMDYRQDRRVA